MRNVYRHNLSPQFSRIVEEDQFVLQRATTPAPFVLVFNQHFPLAGVRSSSTATTLSW